MRRVLLVSAGIVVLVAGGLVAFGLYKRHQGRNIRGYSTQEFVTTDRISQKFY